ncbi:MAG: hypothetical protein ABW133_11450, partial [Polyangiaceae bacterium]
MKKAPAPTAMKKGSRAGREEFTGVSRREQVLAALDLPPQLFKDREAPSSARRRRSNGAKRISTGARSDETMRPLRVLLIEDDASGSPMRDKISDEFRMSRAPSLEDACTALGRDS